MKFINLKTTTHLLIVLVFLACGCGAKAKAERHQKRGDEYYAKGELEKAKLEYLNAVRNKSQDPQVWSRLGECFLKEGDAKDAAGCFVQSRNLQPTNIVVRQQLASLLVALGQTKPAAAEAEAILKLAPSDPQAIVMLAQTSVTKEEIAAAKTRISALEASSPTNAAVPFALGLLALKARELDEARANYEKAISLNPKEASYQRALADLANSRGDTNTADAFYKSAVSLAPVKSWDRLRYAEYLLKMQRTDEAQKFLEETVQNAPDFVRALNLLTETLLNSKKVDEAEKYISKTLAVAPTNMDALLNRARLKLVRRDAAGAVAELEDLAKTYQRESSVQYQLAVAYLANKQPTKALVALENTVTLDPKNVTAVLLRSELQIQNEDYNPAIQELTRIGREFPQNLQAQFLLGSAYSKRRSFNEALPIYAALARALPKDPRPLYLVGTTYRQLRNNQEARTALTGSLKINPDFAAAIDELTTLDIEEKKFDSAMARLRPYLNKYADKPLPLLLEGKVLAAQEKKEEAIKAVEKAVELDPEFQPGQRVLLDLYLASGKQNEAITRLNETIKKNPADISSLFRLALLQEAGKDFKGARASYEAILKVNPNSAPALNNLANVLAEQFGEADAAFAYAQKAHEQAPNDPSVGDTFGWALLKKGEYARALSVLQEGADKLSNIPEALYHLGLAYYLNGGEAAAAKYLEASLSGKNPVPWQDKARAALATLKIDPTSANAQSVQALESALQQNPKDFVAQLRLAQILDHRKQWEKAVENYQAAVKLNPRSTNSLARLADLTCFTLGNPAKGLEFAKQAWALSQDGTLAATLGPVGCTAGDFKWASAVLAEARQAEPANARVLFYQALASYALADFKQAKERMADAIQAAGQSVAPLAKESLALISFHLDGSNPAPATAAAAAALQANPKFAPALIVSGLLAEQNGDFNRARTQYEEVLKIFPAHLAAQRQLGLLMAEKLANDQQAAPLLAAVNRELPDDPQVAKALGKMAYRRADYKEASSLLKDCLVNSPDDADILYHLGLAQYHLNERQARNSLNEALKLDPKSTLAASAQKALAELK